jgi:4-aminobutyrate aminotransferase-like enzyme
VTTHEQMTAETLHDLRSQFVPRGVPNPKLVVARAEGATIEDVDGRTFLDFVGGIGCQNLGHGHEAIVDAVHAQVDRFLHQMAGIGSYEPYIEVAQKLSLSSPCPGANKTLLVNSGAEAVENAVKIARAATKRPAVLVFDRAFHGRTLLAMTMTAKLVYRKGFGPFAPEVYRAPAPYEYRGITSDDAIAAIERLFKSELDPATVGLPEPAQGAARPVRDPLRQRRDPVGVWAHRHDVGDRALWRRARPDDDREVARRRVAACCSHRSC